MWARALPRVHVSGSTGPRESLTPRAGVRSAWLSGGGSCTGTFKTTRCSGGEPALGICAWRNRGVLGAKGLVTTKSRWSAGEAGAVEKGMTSQGIEELRKNVSNLFPLLRQLAELLLTVPNSAGLFSLALLRAKVAENMTGIRALEMRNATDVSELPPEDITVIHIARDWALPFPPPSLTYADPPEMPRPFPLRSHDLEEEALGLVPDWIAEPPRLEFEAFSSRELGIATDRLFNALIEAIFTVGGAEGAEREVGLPRLARTRAEFVSHMMALNMLPGPGTTIGSLRGEDKKILAVVHRWAVPKE